MVHCETPPRADHIKAASGYAGFISVGEAERFPVESLTRPALCLMTLLAKETSPPAFFPLRRGLWGEGVAIFNQPCNFHFALFAKTTYTGVRGKAVKLSRTYSQLPARYWVAEYYFSASRRGPGVADLSAFTHITSTSLYDGHYLCLNTLSQTFRTKQMKG